MDPNVVPPRGWGPAILAKFKMWANRLKVLESGEVSVF
jgi:hypothetical protein